MVPFEALNVAQISVAQPKSPVLAGLGQRNQPIFDFFIFINQQRHIPKAPLADRECTAWQSNAYATLINCILGHPTGPEYVSDLLMRWAKKRGISIAYIQPVTGQATQQNDYIERYNRTVRHEWHDQNIFEKIEEAQVQATEWLWTYKNDRPNMAIGGITPHMKLKMAA